MAKTNPVSDQGTRVSICKEFSALYKKEWYKARLSLKAMKSDAEIIYILLRLVRAIYDYCSESAVSSRKSEESVTRDFIEHRLPKELERESVTKELKQFIYSCIQITYKMVRHTPPIWIHWQPKGDEINRDLFDCEGKPGSSVDWTVWPALLDETGTVLSKGKVIPIT